MPSIYILQSDKNGKYYIGSTTDLKRRIRQHQLGHTHTTKRLGKLKLVFSQDVKSLKIAREAERRIKNWKRRDFIDKIVKEGKIKFLEGIKS